MSERIQLSRKKGFKLPPNTVTVARPSRWGNPFRINWLVNVYGIDEPITINCELAVALYAAAMRPEERLLAAMELKGKNLACWCPLPKPGKRDLCHAAVLLDLANK